MEFDPEGVRQIARQAKTALRRRYRALREALPPSAIALRSRRIVERLTTLEVVERARGVGLYWPMEGRGEVDLRPLDAWLRERQRRVYYPFMDPRGETYQTGFRLVESTATLAERGQRFFEPPRDAEDANRGDLEVVIVPAVAAAPTGHRLGYGSGFYDVTLPDFCPPATAIVVVHHFQLLPELPTEEHDETAPLVVTDEGVYGPGASATCPRLPPLNNREPQG